MDASVLIDLRRRHKLTVEAAAALARVEPWAWRYWEECGCPASRAGAIELVGMKLLDAHTIAIVEMIA